MSENEEKHPHERNLFYSDNKNWFILGKFSIMDHLRAQKSRRVESRYLRQLLLSLRNHRESFFPPAHQPLHHLPPRLDKWNKKKANICMPRFFLTPLGQRTILETLWCALSVNVKWQEVSCLRGEQFFVEKELLHCFRFEGRMNDTRRRELSWVIRGLMSRRLTLIQDFSRLCLSWTA